MAEQAVLAVVAEQVCVGAEKNKEGTRPNFPAGKTHEGAHTGSCELTLDHIAALAGVCRSSVKNAIRQAQRLGFVRIEVRRRSAWRNDPNVITIISPEWLLWLRMRRRGEGSKPYLPRVQEVRKPSESRSTPDAQKGFRQAEGRVGSRPSKILRAPGSQQRER
jgi:hypothetical protein